MKIILDLDGTVVNRSGVITQNLLNYLHKNGNSLDISICTGRFSDYVLEIIKKIKLGDSYHICDGGGRIVDNTGSTIWVKEIDSQIIKLTHEIQNLFDIDLLLSDKISDFKINSIAQIILRRVKDEHLESIIKMYPRNLANIQKVWYWEGHGHTLSITAQNIDKGQALKKLTEIENLHLNDCVMVADGNNDIPCFKICGTKIAMGNSSKQLSELADYCVDTVDNDGVIEALELILNRH